MKKIFEAVLMLIVFTFAYVDIISFAGDPHILYRDWYNEDVTGLPKEEVTSITFVDDGDPKEYDRTWDMDGRGLKGFIVNNSDIIISIPVGDILKADSNAKELFSFYKYDESHEFEVDENNTLIRGVRKEDNLDDDAYSEIKSKLEYIDNIELLNTDATYTMESMFRNDRKLTRLNLCYFNTKNLSDMNSMFAGCESLNYVDLSSFDLTNIATLSNVFGSTKEIRSDNAIREMVPFSLQSNDAFYIVSKTPTPMRLIISDSFAEKLSSSGLNGVYENLDTHEIYNDKDPNLKNIKFTGGTYIKKQGT